MADIAPDIISIKGLRFGLASAILSAIVILVSLRPLAKFKVAAFVALVTIALVDSIADAYALYNAEHDSATSTSATATALSSIAAKVTVCGGLALVIYFRATPALIYGILGLMVISHLAMTGLAKEGTSIGATTAIFAAAVALSLGLNKLVRTLESK